MAAFKKLGLTNDSKKNEVLLKDRVLELEDEVSHLKKRLDELRKAKNTTILKREREVLEVGTPFLKRDSKASLVPPAPAPAPVPAPKAPRDDKIHADFQNKLEALKKKLDEAEQNHQQQLVDASRKLTNVKKDNEEALGKLRKQFTTQMEGVKKELVEEYACDHEIIIDALRAKIEELQDTNDALIIENSDLQDRVGSLVTELSIKEAKWCENEEKLKLQLERSWGEKYKEWMEKTELKIRELQESNFLLRGYLKNQKPKGLDPTGQDKT